MSAPAGLTIREAIATDLPGVQKLYLEFRNRTLNAPVSTQRAEQFLVELRRYSGSVLLVGIVDAEPATTCTLVVVPNLTRQAMPYALIENVATDHEQQGRGYGTAMLHEAARRAWEAGCYKVMLMTGSKDPAVLRFYEKAGFEQSKTGFQMRNAAAT